MIEKVVYAKVKVVVCQSEDIDTEEILDDMEYSFESNTPGAEISDTEIVDWDDNTEKVW